MRTMFGIGFQEMLIILVVVLIFFGPKRLPDLAKSLGKGIAEFKKASDEIRKGIDEAVKEEETKGAAAASPAPETPSQAGDAPSAPATADGKDVPPEDSPPAPPSAPAG